MRVLILLSVLGLAPVWQLASQPGQRATELACRSWKYAVSSLTPQQRELLRREGAAFGLESLLLSEELITDCLTRVQVGGYIRRAAQERPQPADGDIARQHSQLIVEVARRLWPGQALAEAESGVHGRYNVLADTNLAPAHVGPFAADVLREEGFTVDLVWALLQRPLPQVRPALVEQLRLAEQTDNVHDQIYALSLLHYLGDVGALPRLRKLRGSDQLSNFEREFLPRLVAGLDAGRRLTFADLEPLELYNER